MEDFTTVRYLLRISKNKNTDTNTDKANAKSNSDVHVLAKKRIHNKRPVNWELAFDAAIRCQTMGRIGIELNGRYYSSDEIKQNCHFRNPLPPFEVY
jgi:hypothetical protein